MKLILILFITVSAMAAANSSLQFVPFSSTGASTMTAQGVLPLASGSVAVFGQEKVSPCLGSAFFLPITCNQAQAPLLAILNSAGTQTSTLAISALGNGNSSIASAAVDGSGNIWITGETNSDDFPLTQALYTQKTAYQYTGFVAKLSPSLNILFATFFGAVSNPAAIALDSTGNAYITGSADISFPVTGTLFGPTSSSGVTYAFVMKLASDGSKVIYSRLLGGSANGCNGSNCIGSAVATLPSVIAIDAAGNATVAGLTTTTNFPLTTGVYHSAGTAFVSRISADGSTLLWSTELGVTPAITPLGTNLSSIQAIALDSAANVYVAGGSWNPIATTAGALQSTYPYNPGQGIFASGFVVKLSSDATQQLLATNLGGSNGSTLTGMALDSASNVWVTGLTTSSDFPGLNATAPTGLDFALELNASFSAIQQIFPLIPQTFSQPPAFDSNGNLLLLGSAGNLLRLNAATAYSAPAVFALTDAAVPAAVTTIAPGEIMTVYGTGLGPSTGIVGAPDSTGYFPTTLGGVSIEWGGVPAPLLYAGPTQINFEVPLTSSSPLPLTITTPIGALPALAMKVAGSIGIFGVLNSDGTVNSATNPAQEGSIVSLYLTGLGLAGSPARDGAISTSANSAFMNLITVNSSVTRAPLTVLYAGTAPDLIDGLAQINVQLPSLAQNPILAYQNPYLTVVVPSAYNTTLPATSNAFMIYAH